VKLQTTIASASEKHNEDMNKLKEVSERRDETITRRDQDIATLKEAIEKRDAEINRNMERANKVYMRLFLAQIRYNPFPLPPPPSPSFSFSRTKITNQSG
jgi:hypothetical protein